MAFLKTLTQAVLTTFGVLCGIYSFGVLVSYPSDKSKAEKLRAALQEANKILIQSPDALPVGEFGSGRRFKADIGYGRADEIYLSILEWRRVDLDNTYDFPGGSSSSGPPGDYLLCYWRGEWFEILDSKTGKTSLDHQLSIIPRIPTILISAGLAWASFRLRRHIVQS